VALYLPRHNALFLVPPQVVGTEIRKTVQRLGLKFERIGHPHATLDQLAGFRADRRPVTVAFVANPLTWYAAYWRHARQRDPRWSNPRHASATDDVAWPLDPAFGADDFAEFLDRATRREGFLHELFARYTGLGTAEEVAVVGKSEQLGGQLVRVLESLGIRAPGEVAEEIPRRPRYRGQYTPELETMVVHAEEATFDAYGYPRPRLDRRLLQRRRAEVPLRPSDIPGWLSDLDREMFRHILGWQAEHEPPGDLVELGAYLGKSAVIIGEWRREGETFTVCDLFGADAADVANLTENRRVYTSVTRQKFEQNYRTFRGDLPVVHQMLTSQILDHVAPDSARFVHVDASHLYDHVVIDIESSAAMLRPGGVVVFDDYRSPHTPGVAAAVWTAMATKGLRPIVITPMKWYGTWGDPAPLQRELLAWLRADQRFGAQIQRIAGADVLRAFVRRGRAEDYEDDPPVPAEG
jgi:predicted O-methyltransferase YrrM